MPKIWQKHILFSAAEARSCAAGIKTQFRRPIQLQEFKPSTTRGYDWTFRGTRSFRHRGYGGCWQDFRQQDLVHDRRWCPFAYEQLWVREGWAALSPHEDPAPLSECQFQYRADALPGQLPGGWHRAPDDPSALRWRSASHMPRFAARSVLRVLSIRIQRLQEITPPDAYAEGLEKPANRSVEDIAALFLAHWDRTYGKSAPSKLNPYVWAVSFEAL